MPGKMARSDPRPSVRVTRGAGSGQHLASVLQEGRENANIDAGLGFIWRILDKPLGALFAERCSSLLPCDGLVVCARLPDRSKIGPSVRAPALLAPPVGLALHAILVTALYALGLKLISASLIVAGLAAPGVFLTIRDCLGHRWQRSDVAVWASLVAIVFLILLPKWLAAPDFSVFQGNIGDQFYYLTTAFMATRYDFVTLDHLPVGPVALVGLDLAAPYQLIQRPSISFMLGSVSLLLHRPVLPTSYAFLSALQTCIFCASFVLLRNLFPVSLPLAIIAGASATIGFFVQYTFDINAWSHLASASLLIAFVALFSLAAPLTTAGLFFSLVACLTGMLYVYPELMPMPVAIIAAIAIWQLISGDRTIVVRRLAFLGAASALTLIFCIPAWSMTAGFLLNLGRWVIGSTYGRDTENWWMYFKIKIFKSLHPRGLYKPYLIFLAPRTRTDSDFRLARSVIFTKLEYLILNHRQLTQQRATAAQLDARGNPR